MTGDYSLRNLIVLRSLFDVFPLGCRADKITPAEEDLYERNRISQITHEKANKLSLEEVKPFAGGIVKSKIRQAKTNEFL